MAKYILIFLLGFIGHKISYEVICYNINVRYEKCLKVAVKGIEKSPYQQCKSLLSYTKVEDIILYQYNYWSKNATL